MKGLLDYSRLKTVILLAIPAIIENLLQVFIGVVDTYFVGRIGTDAIAGVGITNLTMNIYIAFFLALGIGTTAVVSRYVGAQKKKETQVAVKQSLIMAIIIGVIVGLINLIFSKRMLLLLGATEEVLNYALPYFLTVAVPSVFLCVNIVLSAVLRGSGDTKTPMKVAVIANFANAFLDYVLIFGLLSFSGFGVIGAGLATTFARIISTGLLLRKLTHKTSNIKISIFADWKIDYQAMGKIIKISIPAAFERLIMRSGQLIYGGLIIKIGTEAYAAHNVAGIIETFSYLPGMGFGIAAATLVGQNLGKNEREEAKRYGIISYLLSAFLMVLIGIIFYIFAPFLAGIFTKDEVVLELVVKVLRIIALFQPFLCATLVITSALQGAGDTKFPMYSSLIGIWGIRVVGVYLLSTRLGYGLVGVWMAYSADIIVRGVILMVRFIKDKWKNIVIS